MENGKISRVLPQAQKRNPHYKTMIEKFKWDSNELRVFQSFKIPMDIQLFLNELKYNPDAKVCKSPRMVLEDRTAHCTEGAYLGAAALRFLDYQPLIVDLVAENDDDHLLAVFKKNNLWGAVAKSNTTALRYRDPIYRSLRELVMSYFEFYFNINGVKTLKNYSKPVNLTRFDKQEWMYTPKDLHFITDHLARVKHYDIADKNTLKHLPKADPDVLNAVFLNANEKGLYKPKKN